jgi:hypothetical protein
MHINDVNDMDIDRDDREIRKRNDENKKEEKKS